MEILSIVSILSILQLAAAAQSVKDCKTVDIGTKKYHSEVLLNIKVYKDIVVDQEENVFYINHSDGSPYILKPEQSAGIKITGLTDTVTQDIILDKEDVLIFTMFQGIYKYNYENNSVVPFIRTDKTLLYAGKTAHGPILVVGFNSLHLITNGAMQDVRGLRGASSFSYDGASNLYYSTRSSPWTVFLMMKGKQQSEGVPVRGFSLEKRTALFAYRSSDNVMYICREDGFYFLQPPSASVTRVQPYQDASAVGFDTQGNIYLGANSKLLKLVPTTETCA